MDILSDILILSQKTESQLLLNYKEQSQDIESQLKEAKAKFEELKKKRRLITRVSLGSKSQQ